MTVSCVSHVNSSPSGGQIVVGGVLHLPEASPTLEMLCLLKKHSAVSKFSLTKLHQSQLLLADTLLSKDSS